MHLALVIFLENSLMNGSTLPEETTDMDPLFNLSKKVRPISPISPITSRNILSLILPFPLQMKNLLEPIIHSQLAIGVTEMKLIIETRNIAPQ